MGLREQNHWRRRLGTGLSGIEGYTLEGITPSIALTKVQMSAPLLGFYIAAIKCQAELMRLSKEIEAANAKEYDAPWLKENKTVMRDNSGQFASRSANAINDDPIRLSVESLKTEEARQLAQDIDFAKTPEAINEVVTKRIAYLNPQEVMGNESMSEKTQYGLQFLADKGIEVKDVLNDPETGFNAFGVKNKDGTRQLVFTGSNDQKDWDQNKWDNEVGRTQFEANKDDIQAILESAIAESGQKSRVSGHSLGGALAQITASEFPEMISKVDVYNSASISTETATKYAEARKSADTPAVTLHYHKADPVPGLKGSAILNGNINVYGTKKVVGATKAHMDILSDPRNNLAKIKVPSSYTKMQLPVA